MLDRSRRAQLGWAALLLALFALLLVGVVTGFGPLARFDARGDPAEDWAVGRGGLRSTLLVVEALFATVGMTVLTVVLALAMLLRGHRRAAGFTVLVMVATSVVTTLVKVAVGRARPEWQLSTAVLSSKAFPSGHASAVAAYGGVVAVLVMMLVRRAQTRRLVYGVIVVLVVLVCLDRVLLGRHFPSDVVGGVLLGGAMVLVGLAVLSPLPRSHARRSDPLPEAYPSSRQLAVVLNPVKVDSVEGFKAIVSQQARAAGWQEPAWFTTTVEDPGTGMAAAAAEAGADLVLVCGGDGTVREVCAELAGTGIPVGIVPAGTGNLLARNLDIPLFLRAAVDVALTGQDRAIDMVRVSGDAMEPTHFMVMAGMGFDAAIMEGVNDELKARVGWIAYVASALKSLMYPAVRLEISVDDAPFTKHGARTIVVGNVGYLQAGLPLLPDAKIDDGVLDVVLLHPRRFLSWLPLTYRVLARRPRTDDTIMRMTGRSVVLRTTADTPRQLDGDSVGAGRELRMECVHGRVLVRVPR